jgi:hypothetical protein
MSARLTGRKAGGGSQKNQKPMNDQKPSRQTEGAIGGCLHPLARRRMEIKEQIKRLTEELGTINYEIRNQKKWPAEGQRIRFSRLTCRGREWFGGVFHKEGRAHIVTDSGEKMLFINRGWEPSNDQTELPARITPVAHDNPKP